MSKYYVMKHTKHESTHVDLAEAITDLGYVHMRKKQKDELTYLDLLDMLDDMESRTDQAEAAAHQARVERDEAKAEAMTALEAVEKMTAERDQARQARDINASHRDEARKAHNKARANCVLLRETVAKLSAELDARPSKLSCLNCGSSDYVWCFDNGESAYCSKCSPDTPPPPKPLLKFLPCPECGRLLTTLSEHLPPGRCCLCGAELSPPVCPHCGHDTFKPLAGGGVLNRAVFNADGALYPRGLYFFVCAKCGKEVGTLPLKRADK